MTNQENSSQFKKKKTANKFYALFIPNDPIGDCIDAIRYISFPSEKNSCHITVRGPYKKRIPIQKINNKFQGNIVRITGVGNFFDENQNTVFLECDGTKLRNVWKKQNYGYKPHITIYDGGDESFARLLYKTMKSYYLNLSFKADELKPITQSKGQESMELDLKIGSNVLSCSTGSPNLNLKELKNLPISKKVDVIKTLCQKLSDLSKVS